MTKKDETKRTVAALLQTGKKKESKGRLFGRADQEKPEHRYIYCRSKNIAKRFLKDAEAEGFTFGDGIVPTQKDPDDIFALYDDFTISYIGFAGHMLFHNPGAGKVVRIDYGKYIAEAEDYVM